MAYRLRYKVSIDWVGAGMGPMSGVGAGIAPGGGASNLTMKFEQNPVSGPIVSGSGAASPGGSALAAADLVTLVAGMATDVGTQLTAALPRLAAWPAGGAAAQ